MSTRNVRRSGGKEPPAKRPPVLWTRVLMGFALNVMVVTLGVASLGDVVYGWLLILIGPAVFGVLTALVVRQRAGLHVFLAGMLSVPFLALFVLPPALSWFYAILAGGVFALAGLFTDLLRRWLPN